MLRKRMLIGLGGCFLASGSAWADGVAYVDCASHPETTLVFGKPRRTPETVAAIACGERFTIYPCRGEYAEFTPAKRRSLRMDERSSSRCPPPFLPMSG